MSKNAVSESFQTTPPAGTTAESAMSLQSAWAHASLATAIWASNVVAVKFALREMPGLTTALARVTLAGLALVAVHKLRKLPFALPREEWPGFVALGFFGIAVSFTFFTCAMQYTSVSHAVFIAALLPIMVMVVAALTGQERLTASRSIGLIVAMAGMVMLEMDQTVVARGRGVVASNWRGDLMALGGASCFTFFTIRGKQLAARYDSGTVNMYAFGLGAMFCAPLLAWIGLTDTPNSLKVNVSEVSWVAWTSLLISGTAGSALPYYVYYKSLKVLKASQAAALHYVQPVLATLLGVAFLGERLGPQFAVAAALILLGVFIAERR